MTCSLDYGEEDIMPKNPYADFSPTLQGYSGQGTFKFWCQLALPLTFDDSLSYYELLNKVVTYLNNTIDDVKNVEDNVEALNEAFGNLQQYVLDYFDNIDIENELRNVLDRMAEDGSLDSLLDPIVASRLGDVVAQQINAVVANQIDASVGRQINQSVEQQLPAVIPDAVSDWLDENITPTTPIVDPSLNISGAAADAKVTGDKIKEINDIVDVITKTDYDFTLEYYVDAYGEIRENDYMAMTQRIPCRAGNLVVRNTINADVNDKHLVIYVAEFNGTTPVQRTELMYEGDNVSISDTTDNIIICFGRYAASETLITNEDITQYFDVNIYENYLNKAEFEKYVKNESFYNRGNVIDAGYTSFSQCRLPGLYTFSTQNLSTISDAPYGLNIGGLLIVYNAGSVIWQEIHTTYYEFIRYGASGTWIDKHDFVRVAYSNTSGEDSSVESIDIFIQRDVTGRKIRYNMGHCVDNANNCNVWRIMYMFSLAAHQIDGTKMTRRGEFECALHLQGRGDFSGGYVHGDEVDQNVNFFGDGVVLNAENTSGFYKEFKIVRNSLLYDPNDHTTVIAEHGVEYIYTAKGLTINQSVKWRVNASLTSCYLAMLPLFKTFSTYRYDDTDFIVTENNQNNYSVSIDNATSVTEYINDISTTMMINKYPENLPGGNRALITDNQGENYNKVYFVVCTSGNVEIGTLWKATTRYVVE